MSAGRRSGVNWIRRKPRPRPAAKDLAINVFARPGTSSISRWPSPRTAQRTRSSTGRLPTITRSTASRMDPLTSATEATFIATPPSAGGPWHGPGKRIELARADRLRRDRTDEGARLRRPAEDLTPREERDHAEEDEAEAPLNRAAVLCVIEEESEDDRRSYDHECGGDRPRRPPAGSRWTVHPGEKGPRAHITPPGPPGSCRGCRSPAPDRGRQAGARCTAPPRIGRSRSPSPPARRASGRRPAPRAPEGSADPAS